MALLRGKGLGLEVVFAGRDIDEALLELEARLSERPDFYRGTGATAVFGTQVPTPEQLDALRGQLELGGIVLRGLSGGPAIEALAADRGLECVAARVEEHELERRRAMRPKRDVQLSESARSLVADFAGARSDIAGRRKAGETSIRRVEPPPVAPAVPVPLSVVEPPIATFYHVGTLRGGQSLHHVGNLIVVGDVNPGAELIATGDIVIFGALRGVAHAGAQGDAGAKVYALDLAATQLRIATFIAADAGGRGTRQPEAALVRAGRIVIVAYTDIDRLREEAT
jgi:septum site-determining protein MinC